MSPTSAELLERFRIACDLKQPIDRARIEERMLAWTRGVTGVTLRVAFIERDDHYKEVARAARDARDAWAARDARVAWDARAAWDAWDARAAWDAWAARDARDAWAAWDASYYSITAIGAADRANEELLTTWLPLFEAFEAGAFCFFIAAGAVHVATLPTRVCVDERRRLHCSDGPAFAFIEDVRKFYWHGVHVPEHVVTRPETITVTDIGAAPNAEVRRVMIERYGQARYLNDCGAQMVAADEFGELYRKDLAGDEPLLMVKVRNSTPEPDGSVKDYWLRVPPSMSTAHEAVAWTFGLTPAHYVPLAQT